MKKSTYRNVETRQVIFFVRNVVKRHFDGYLNIPLRLLWLFVRKWRNGSEEVLPGVLFLHVALVALPDPQPR